LTGPFPVDDNRLIFRPGIFEITQRIDLHLHTTFSDGTLTPEATVREALRLGLGMIAICDHDTTEGVPPAQREAAGKPLRVVAGIELNTDYQGAEVHILGYGLEVGAQSLQQALERMRSGRSNRNEAILERLRALGMPLAEETLAEIAGGEIIARPHIAEAMVRAGYVESRQEAFNRFLAKGAKAFTERYSLTPLEACRVIVESRGIAVLAHPGKLDFRKIIEELLPAGLRGLEIYHPDNRDGQRRSLLALARREGLLVTGGTDSHGPGSGRQLELGSLSVPEKHIADFVAALEAVPAGD
jgi:3',5'-nucleoside bisphosphate phosphatase